MEDLDKSILELVEEGNIDKEIEEWEGIKDKIHLNLLKLDSLLKGWRHFHNLWNHLRCVKVLKLQGQHHIQLRLIFDPGSQRSYVSTRLRNALQLPTINQDTLVINKFGSETGQIQSRDLVQICVQGMTSETYLYILRVDTCDQSVDESSENRALERKLAEFWDLEAIGISPEEKSVYERFNEDITFKDGR